MLTELIAGIIKGLYDVINNAISAHQPSVIKQTQDRLVKNEFIQLRLDALISQLGCARVYVVQFHNGSYFYSGNSMQKFSCTYEAINAGVSSTMGELQGRLVSEFPFIHSAILVQGEYYVSDVSKLDDSNAAKQKWVAKGIKTFYATGIWDLSGNLVGNISVNYNWTPHDMTENEKELLRDFARLIVGYILPAPKLRQSMLVKFIIGFFILMFLSQVFYFLVNLTHFLEILGPTAQDVIKTLSGYL